MSDVHSTPKHSTPSAIPSPYPDLAALAVSLQETAQALLTFSATNADEDTSPSPAKPVRDRDGETRSFYFPPASVNMERELLRKYRAQDFQGLLEEVHTLLVGLVKLMQSVHKDVRVRGYVIASLGAQIDHASALVLRMRHVYDGVMPVEK